MKENYKMLQKGSEFQRVCLRALLVVGMVLRPGGAAQEEKEAAGPPDGGGGDGGAFFALRSCHQLLGGVSGEFFSPDYLCSNPPLWCNWTLRADPGQRIHLHLEDLTPDHTCHLKRDQIHVDEPGGHAASHKVLQKCWREAKFTSSSDTLYVVLLIGGRPSHSYRGFYGRYQAFGPLVLYNPGEGGTGSSPEVETTPDPPSAWSGSEADAGSERSDPMDGYHELHAAMTAGLPRQLAGASEMEGKVGEKLHRSLENPRPLHPLTPSVRPSRINRSGGGVPPSPSSPSHSPLHPVSPQQLQVTDLYELTSSTLPPTVVWGERTTAQIHGPGQTWSHAARNTTRVQGISNEQPPSTRSTEPTHPQPNMVEPLSDSRGRLNMRNQSVAPHIPGDHLLEVSVEVYFILDLNQSWDGGSKSLLQWVKALISSQLGALQLLPILSSKRIKRLHAGALYILWLQVRRAPGGGQVHSAIHSALQDLVSAGPGPTENQRNRIIMSISIADVNECGTHLVLCDVNADCVNHFGSYSCRCRPGFQDRSRLGSGGTLCVEVKAAGCRSGLTSETKGVYVLFFLLSCLILTLLAVAGMLYHRHHRGAFLVRCHSSDSVSPNDSNNNHRPQDGFSDLPPPLPARGHREVWPPVKDRRPAADLPLLRFGLLVPPDGHLEPRGRRDQTS